MKGNTLSLNAYVWAAELPLNIVSHTAFRVLLKYADSADNHGMTSWHSTQRLSEELGCSKRTVQRAIHELVETGLLVEGDQRFTDHIRNGHRPVVYDLAMTPEIQAKLPGYGVTNMSWGDSSEHSGVTTVVALGTVNRTPIESITTKYRESVTPQPPAAPRFPRFKPDPPRQKVPPLTDDELAAVRLASGLKCSAGIGDGSLKNHWFPAEKFAECARCGKHAFDLINRK